MGFSPFPRDIGGYWRILEDIGGFLEDSWRILGGFFGRVDSGILADSGSGSFTLKNITERKIRCDIEMDFLNRPWIPSNPDPCPGDTFHPFPAHPSTAIDANFRCQSNRNQLAAITHTHTHTHTHSSHQSLPNPNQST